MGLNGEPLIKDVDDVQILFVEEDGKLIFRNEFDQKDSEVTL
jgi:hypothetical protein